MWGRQGGDLALWCLDCGLQRLGPSHTQPCRPVALTQSYHYPESWKSGCGLTCGPEGR